MKNTTTIVLIAGILLLVNVLSRQFFLRFDLTEDRQYTLSKATKDILANLEEPVTVTAYFTEGLPAEYANVRKDFQDMLIEYSSRSKGMLDYEFINPNESDELEQEAAQNGVQPVMIGVREKDQMKQQRAFIGAVIRMGERQEVIPLIQTGTAMEYALSTSLKKLSVVDKPFIGLIQGHGEPAFSDLAQVIQSLSILYTVENLSLENEESIPERYQTVALVAPKDSIAPSSLAKLDDHLARGGNLFIALNAVEGDFSTAQGTALTTGLEGWLGEKGLAIDQSFVIDAICGQVQVQQQQGFFRIASQVQFPYFPLIQQFPEHPITTGLEQVILQFASPIRFAGDSLSRFTPILQSSENAGTLTAPTFFQVQKNWSKADFPMSNIILGGVLEGNLAGELPSRIVVISDGDFAVSGQQGGQAPDNISLMVNSIDWLSDDTGLIELRTKGVVTRPIEELEDSTRSTLKWINMGLPILLIIIYGFLRSQRQRNLRLQRMQERYS